MAHKIAITLALLALFGGAYAATQSFTGTASSFVFAPTTSHAAATAVDSANLIGFQQWAVYGGSATDGVAYLYQLGKAFDSTSTSTSTYSQPANADCTGGTACEVIKLWSRKLYSANFTTFGTNGVAAPATSDVAATTTFTWNTPSYMTATTDLVGWVATYDSATYIQICVAVGQGAVACKSKTAAETAITVQSFWCDGVAKNCYVLYSISATAVYKVMGVTSAGAFVWTAEVVTVGTQSAATASTAGVVWGNSTNTTLNTVVNVAYLDGAASCATTGVCNIKYTSVAVAAATTATVPATPLTVVTNVATAIYSPCGGVVTNTTNALILCFQNALTASTPTVYNLTAVFAPYQKTSFAATDLQYLNVTKITSPFVGAWGSYYGDGFFLVNYAGATTSYSAYYNTYNSTGFNLTNGGLTLGTYTADPAARGNWFITANSSLGYGYISYDDAAAYVGTAASVVGRTATCMAGGIANSMYAGASSGSILASFVAFVAVMIASLFAF